MSSLDLKNTSIEINNIESLLESLSAEHEVPYHNSFLYTHEQGLMDNQTYHSMQFDKYGYVANLIDDFF